MSDYSYQEAIKFFKALPHFVPPKDKSGTDMFSLDAELALLEKMGNPHKDLKYVHVAGTNGKGSTTTFIESILISAKINVGSFTSPFLYHYNEMFKVGGVEISEEEFAEVFSFVKPLYEELAKEGIHPSEYEILTSMAFEYFKRKGCEIVLMEVSLGGRVDTTNVIPSPLVTVITPISYDHMTVLGPTLTDIAKEKAGIIKPGTTVVSAEQEKEVALVLEETCKKNLVQIYSGCSSEIISRNLKGQTFRVGERVYETSMLGIYQLQNAALAIRAAEELVKKGYGITEENMREGIANTKWYGRFTLIQENPPVIIDGGHNRQGAQVLRESLEVYFPGQKITFVLGILRDKEVDLILDTILPIADRCYTVAVPNARTMEPKELADMIRKRGVEATVLSEVKLENLQETENPVCIAGSLYLLQRV